MSILDYGRYLGQDGIVRHILARTNTKQQTLYLWPDTATLLGIGRNAVYGAARRGEFRTIRIGKRILVPKSEIRRLLSPRA
jgi:excisionase family DNA binding protein